MIAQHSHKILTITLLLLEHLMGHTAYRSTFGLIWAILKKIFNIPKEEEKNG